MGCCGNLRLDCRSAQRSRCGQTSRHGREGGNDLLGDTFGPEHVQGERRGWCSRSSVYRIAPDGSRGMAGARLRALWRVLPASRVGPEDPGAYRSCLGLTPARGPGWVFHSLASRQGHSLGPTPRLRVGASLPQRAPGAKSEPCLPPGLNRPAEAGRSTACSPSRGR